MGTTCETHFVDGKGRTCAVMWRAQDGYPTSHGAELQDLLGTFQLVEGLVTDTASNRTASRNAEKPRRATGMPCVAAQAVAYFKTHGSGYFYLQPSGYFDMPPSFRYTAHVDGGGTLCLRCEVSAIDAHVDLEAVSRPGIPVPHSWRLLYDGPASSFDPEDAEQTAFDEYDDDDVEPEST